LLLRVAVLSAGIQDADGGGDLLELAKPDCPRLELVWADGAYRGPLVSWVAEHLGWRLEINATPPDQQGFQVLPRRWVVERTFAWLGRHRRLSKDYEEYGETTEAWVYLAMIRLMLRRRVA